MAGTTISPPQCCWRRCSPRGCAAWCWRRRWWCTGRASTPAPTTAWSTRCRGGAPTSTPGSSSIAVRPAGCRSPGGSSTRMRRCGRAACTRPARPRRSITRWRGRSRAAARWWHCATTTCTAPGCRAIPPIPGWPRSSVRPSKRTNRQGFSRTAGRCVTSCTSTTWPRRTSRRRPLTLMALPPSTSVPGAPSRSSRWPPRCPMRAKARPRRSSPGNTAAGMCVTSSPTPPAPSRCWASGRPSIRATGLGEFAFAPLR